MLHREERADDDEERPGVEEIDDRRPGESEDRTAERGPRDRPDLEDRHVQAERVGKLFRFHQPGDERLARGIVECGRRARQHGEAVDRIGRGAARVRQPGERDGDEREHALGDEHDAPAVEGIGEDPAPERQDGDGQDAEEPEDAEGERRPGEQVELPDHGHLLHLRSGEGDRLPSEQEPVIAGP